MAKSTTARGLIFIVRELIGELLYFPVWWYSHGLVLTWRSLFGQWLRLLNRLSLPILLKTMGRPMYGDYTRSGRIISFFFRILLVVSKSLVLGFWTAVLIVVMIVWIIGPIISFALLARQLIPIQF